MRAWLRNKKEYSVVAFVTSFVIGVFAPIDFYFSTKNEFWVDIYDLILGIIAVALILFVTLFVVMACTDQIPKVGQKIARIIEFIVIYMTIGLYIQGNFLEVPYGALWGADIEWDSYYFYDITSIITWVGIGASLVAVLILSKHEKFIRIMRIILICLCITTAISLVIECINYKGLESKELKRSTVNGEWDYSTQKNFNILVLDTFDSQVLSDLIVKNGSEEYSGLFEDFTFYRDTLGVFTLTDYSVPQILSGEKYLNQSTYGTFVEEAFERSPLLNRLQDEGWKEYIYLTTLLPQGSASEQFENIKKIKYKAILPIDLIVDYYGLVGFRYAPTPVKKVFYDRYLAISENSMVESIDGESVVDKEGAKDISFEWDHVRWVRGTIDIKAVTDDPVFHYYHLQGIHGPREYTLQFEKSQGGDDVSVEEEAEVNCRIIGAWLYYLKQNNVYDNSVIVIMADHGCADYKEDEKNVMQCPLLMIKGYNENHEFQISDMPVSFEDLQEVYSNLLDGKTSVEVFENVMDNAGVEFNNVSDVYSGNELIDKWNDKSDFENKVGRERKIYLSFFRRALGIDGVGGTFYEGATEYPAYNPYHLYVTGKQYDGTTGME